MGITIGLILTVILIALIVLSRRNTSSTDRRRPTPQRHNLAKTGSQFHAVSIRFADNACEAAKAIEDKRILSAEAPRLPLPDCDVLQCKCRFIHHQDRRRAEDRRGQHPQNLLGTTGGYSGKERRYRERRTDGDPEDFFS